jgi:hypothetical protein
LSAAEVCHFNPSACAPLRQHHRQIGTAVMSEQEVHGIGAYRCTTQLAAQCFQGKIGEKGRKLQGFVQSGSCFFA